jgi:hypothetical protein
MATKVFKHVTIMRAIFYANNNMSTVNARNISVYDTTDESL